jgi:superfamily I DNA and/or RNA helicase
MRLDCGGTTWLFASPQLQDAPVDLLLIDEAGQLSLADALAASCSAHSMVLVGDPLQLPQVAQAVHPGQSGRSALEHILGEDLTLHDNRGVFISQTWRMHPDVCGFISEEIYEGRLTSHPDCTRQTTAAGTGLRWFRADHHGNSTASAEEAELIADELCRLIGTTWTNKDGEQHTLKNCDFMVVAPYNDQVNVIRTRLQQDSRTAGVPVGTVDKFQGREAVAVFFSMATSSGDDMRRGADFLFSRNRLNVAVSRARALAYLVCTEDLLNTPARTLDDMRLVATLNAFVEYTQR